MSAELWSFAVVFNLGLLATLLLRAVWRRYCGAGASYALWLLAPMAALATLLPSGKITWQPMIRAWSETAPALTAWVPISIPEQQVWPLWLWAVGALLTLGYFGFARWRLERALHGRMLRFDPRCGRVPLIRADFGPALIGLWRPRLILPSDFEQRYTTAQQSLVLQHELAHLAAGDLWVRSFALLLTVAQWFNPLAWLALQRLIEDQECACDARVLANRTGATRDYAQALLASSSAHSASAALLCSLHRTHPLVRRLTMLKRQPSTAMRRRLATIITLLSLVCGAAIAWAGSAKDGSATARTPDYHVGLTVQIDELPAQIFALGVRSGEAGSASINGEDGDIELSVVVSPTKIADQVLLSMVIKRARTELGRPAIAFMLGASGRIEMGEQRPQGYQGIRLDARILPWSEMVNLPKTASTERALAIDIADRSGLQLENLQLLSDSPLQMRFDAIPVDSVLQLIADTEHLQLTRSGNSLRFEKR